ncbi:DUF6241 domain-containing protein [Paenisporosarcina sp. NPDC076898]|uniref:DUF6241 domain-containing protein n=1 Tax=unclassified Paenisporosarcina TaxID=2642018 RepID=UPI003D02BA3E
MKKIFAPFKITKIQKAAIVVTCVGFFCIFIYLKVKPDLPVILKKDEIMSETIAEDSGATIEVEEDVSTIEAEFPLDMADSEIRTAIHAMSHQKVISDDDEKWGPKIPLTQVRVDRLLEVINARQHEANFENEATYFEILNRWAEGDFSQVARDHNTIWYSQNGNIGYATGVMSPEEEMEYIRVNFNVKD